jgi:hypothetical protein
VKRNCFSVLAVLVAGVLLLATVVPLRAMADTLTYDNGPVYQDGPPGSTKPAGWGIYPPLYWPNGAYFGVSDSFTVNSQTTLDLAQVGIMTYADAPTNLGWSIGTSPYATDISSGSNTSLTSTYLFQDGDLLEDYECDFPVSGSVPPVLTG